MKMKNILFSAFLCAIGLVIAISQLRVNKDLNTDARLRHVERVLADCKDKKGPAFDRTECIYEYGKANDIPEKNRLSWAIDGYGNLPVLEQSSACKATTFCAAYSKGKNGIDECGEGDDVSLHSCK
jgi:hypothetical protein